MSKDEKIIEKVEEDAPFDVQPFDEKEFIRKELISFRTTLVLFVFSVLVAGITFAVWRFAVPGIQFSLLVLIALGLGVALLRFIFKAVRIDVSHWKRREWIGTFFLYFFFWLGFVLLFVNPPFTDAAAPKIEAAALPAAQAPGAAVVLGAYVADNEGLGGDPGFCVHAYNGTAPPSYESLSGAERSACDSDWERLPGQPFWHHNESYPAGSYAVYAVAGDSTGHQATQIETFNVSNPTTVTPPRDNRFAIPDDPFTVRVHPDIYPRMVQFSLDDGGSWYDMVPHPEAARRLENYWRTDATYEGWTAGVHNVSVRVILQPTYLRDDSHVLRAVAMDASGPHRVTVDATIPGIGSKTPDYGRMGNQVLTEYPEYRYVDPSQTPGIEAPLLLATLAGLAVAGRRRAA